MKKHLRGVDILVGTGLHVGMSALSSGCDFIAYKSKKKTRSFMNEIQKHSDSIYPKVRMFSILLLLSKLLRKLITRPSLPVGMPGLINDAEGHFRYLEEQVKLLGERK
jgi:polysaccharide pyruvyl transferase WcaK-like protein